MPSGLNATHLTSSVWPVTGLPIDWPVAASRNHHAWPGEAGEPDGDRVVFADDATQQRTHGKWARTSSAVLVSSGGRALGGGGYEQGICQPAPAGAAMPVGERAVLGGGLGVGYAARS